MEATLPSNWKNLTIEKYDRTTNLDEHINVYVTQITLYTMNNVVLDHVFPTLVKGQIQLIPLKP